MAGPIGFLIVITLNKVIKVDETWGPHFLDLLLSIIVLTIMVRVGYIARKYYRCPKCNEVPYTASFGYLVDPHKCPNCGVRLKAEKGSAL